VTPPVAEAAKVGWPVAAVLAQRRRHLADAQARLRGIDDHLRGELHAGGAHVHPLPGVAAQGPHAAVEVADGHGVHDPRHPRQHRIAEIAVQVRHGTRIDAAQEAVAHHEVQAAAQRSDEGFEARPVVRVVGIGEHHVAAPSRADAGHERGPVAPDRLVHDPRAQRLRDLHRGVRRAVVGHDDFPVHAHAPHGFLGLANAGAQRPLLVEVRHDGGNFGTGKAVEVHDRHGGHCATRRRRRKGAVQCTISR